MTMSDKPIWSGEMRKAGDRFYMALSPVPEKYWTDYVLCSMAYVENGEAKDEEVRLSADEWFALEDAGNFLSGMIMTKA